jgi:cytidine deaminase
MAPLDAEDLLLFKAAREALQRNYHPARHTVGAAVLCASSRIYTGINIQTCGYGPCAEPIALGAAFTRGEREICTIVAVHTRGDEYVVVSPCGNCRQLLVDYAPQAMVIYIDKGQVLKTQAQNLLPGPYLSHLDGM